MRYIVEQVYGGQTWACFKLLLGCRAEVQALQSAKIDLATRLKLAEAQNERLTGRQKSVDAKMKDLKSQLAKVTDDMRLEQKSRVNMVQQMSESVQVIDFPQTSVDFSWNVELTLGPTGLLQIF